MSDDREGFLKLNDNESRRSCTFQQQYSVAASRSRTMKQKGLGMGSLCFKMKLNLNIQREDGNLLICGISLANNCQAIMVIFGFFFVFAGVVLTIISYKTPVNAKLQELESTREQGKVVGPIFIVIGSFLFIIGLLLSLINCRLHREAKILRNRFSLEGLPHILISDTQQHEVKGIFLRTSSSFPPTRRESFFPSNYFVGRRKTLPAISQAVPVGFLIDGKVSGFGRNSPIETIVNRSLNEDSSFSEERPGEANRELSASSRRKASLTLRASLPMPLLGSPHFMKIRSITPVESNYDTTTRSDEPYGSIVSLSGTGDIACFPAHSPRFPPCQEESPSHFPFHANMDMENPSQRSSTNRELPIITINDDDDDARRVNPLRNEKGDENITLISSSSSSLPYQNINLRNDILEDDLLRNDDQSIV